MSPPTRTDCRSHRLLDQENLACAGALGALFHCTLLDLGDPKGNADDDAWLHERAPVVMRASDEVTKHGFGNVEVGDDAVAQRSHGADRTRRAAQHLLGFFAHGEDPLAPAWVGLNGDDRRLAGHDPTPLHIDEGRGRAEIDGEVVREESVEPV